MHELIPKFKTPIGMSLGMFVDDRNINYESN